MKLTKKEFRKKLIKRYSIMFRVCFFLGISKLEITDKDIWKNNNDYECKITEVNLYNPLSYIFLFFFIPIGLIINGCNKQTLRDIKNMLRKY